MINFCRHKIPQEMMGKDQLDMSQYDKIFGTCRIPCFPRDELKFHPTSEHIVVVHKNHFFKVPVTNCNGWMKYNEIMKLLEEVMRMTGEAGPAVGLLTTDNRDSWSKAYSQLCCGEFLIYLKYVHIFLSPLF